MATTSWRYTVNIPQWIMGKGTDGESVAVGVAPALGGMRHAREACPSPQALAIPLEGNQHLLQQAHSTLRCIQDKPNPHLPPPVCCSCIVSMSCSSRPTRPS